MNMAGRYVILEFDDRDAAQAFVMNNTLSSQLGFRVRAMYLKPKKYCECPDKTRQHVGNWNKHAKYGLYVCKRCKLPSKFHERGIIRRLQYVFGFDLLGGDIDA